MNEPYITNVKNSVFRNLRWLLKQKGDKENFLNQVINYCNKLLSDPEEPKRKRVRIRSGKKYHTKKEV